MTRKRSKITDGETLREYQEPEMFKQKFQRSEECGKFRRAWDIAAEGFADTKKFQEWWERLSAKQNAYLRSKRFKKNAAVLKEKRHLWADGKASEGDLEIAELALALRLPLVKYDFDIDRLVMLSHRPTYWGKFIEQCVLFRDIDPYFMRRPLPKSAIEWSNQEQQYVLTIGNIFADTMVKDFQDPSFTAEFKRLQRKLPGYGPIPRSKTTFHKALQIIDLDSDTTLKDYEKAERIEGEVGGLDFGPIENRRAAVIRQVRRRTNKRLPIK